MPRGDGTGPAGMGPMTGWGAGYCAGYDTPGYMNRGFGGMGWGRGGGRGWGRGAGRGWRHWFHATGLTGWQRAGMGVPYQPRMGRADELEMLKEQAEYFANAAEDVKRRISELEKESD